MWHSTIGIILKKIPYSEQKFILKILTHDGGLGTFSISAGRQKHFAHIRSLIGQPMALIEFSFLDQESREIKPIREISSHLNYKNISNDITKQTVTLFINELVMQTIRLPQQDKEMFNFLKNMLHTLDESNKSLSLFPSWFALQLSQQLGFGPKAPDRSTETLFDLLAGKFTEPSLLPGITMDEVSSSCLLQLINSSDVPSFKIPKLQRQVLLNYLLDYFSLHSDFDSDIKSVAVLHAIFE